MFSYRDEEEDGACADDDDGFPPFCDTGGYVNLHDEMAGCRRIGAPRKRSYRGYLLALALRTYMTKDRNVNR